MYFFWLLADFQIYEVIFETLSAWDQPKTLQIRPKKAIPALHTDCQNEPCYTVQLWPISRPLKCKVALSIISNGITVFVQRNTNEATLCWCAAHLTFVKCVFVRQFYSLINSMKWIIIQQFWSSDRQTDRKRDAYHFEFIFVLTIS